MDIIIFMLIIILLAIFIVEFRENKNPRIKNTNHQYQNTHTEQIYCSNSNKSNKNKDEIIDTNKTFRYLPYAKGHLLTKTEHAFFITLVREALKRRLLVCPKVRLEDIIFVTDYRNKLKYRGYIKSRHVDFVLLNRTCETVAAIELDDPSHNTAKAKEIDQFKNELFAKVGIPLIRIKTRVNYIEELNRQFDLLNFPKSEFKKTQP